MSIGCKSFPINIHIQTSVGVDVGVRSLKCSRACAHACVRVRSQVKGAGIFLNDLWCKMFPTQFRSGILKWARFNRPRSAPDDQNIYIISVRTHSLTASKFLTDIVWSPKTINYQQSTCDGNSLVRN